MPDKFLCHAYTNNILRYAKGMHNILEGYEYTENIIRKYLNLLSAYQYVTQHEKTSQTVQKSISIFFHFLRHKRVYFYMV